MRSSKCLAGCGPRSLARSLALRGTQAGGSSDLLCSMEPVALVNVPAGGAKEKHQGKRGQGGNSLMLGVASLFPKLSFWSRTGAWLTAASWGNSAWFPLARSPAPSGRVAAAAETEIRLSPPA